MSKRPTYIDDDNDSVKSEMLMEEIDPDYEPTEQEIWETAVESLGMKLPEDKDYLYLAREALKAPLPESWNVFQGRDGQIYYKHAITQQKMYEHPVDVEYRKRYLQQKEKAARRSAKTKSKPAGVMKLLGSIAQQQQQPEEIYNSYTQQSYEENISNNASKAFVDGLDSKYQKELEQLEKQLKNAFEEFKNREEREHRQRLNRERERHESQLKKIKSMEAGSDMNYDDLLRKQKQKISKDIEENLEHKFQRDIRDFEQMLKKENRKAESAIEGETKAEVSDLENRLNEKIEAREKYLKQLEKDIAEQQVAREKRRREEAARAREEFEQKKRLFDEEASREVQLEVKRQQQIRVGRVNDRELQLEAEYQRIKKLITKSPEDAIKEWVEKKSRMEELNKKKLEAHKAIETQNIEREAKQQLEEEKAKRRKKIQGEYEAKKKDKEQQEEEKMRNQVDSLKCECENRAKKQEEQVYGEYKQKYNEMQLRRNKELMNVRNKFLDELESHNNYDVEEIRKASSKLVLSQKEFQVENKNKMIKALKNDIRMLQNRLRQYELDRKIYRCDSKPEEVTSILKDQIESIRGGIQQRDRRSGQGQNASQGKYIVLKEHEEIISELRKELQEDKLLLQRVYNHIESTSMLPYYEKARILRNNDLPMDVQFQKIQSLTSAKNQLVKLYNSDLRSLRENEKMIAEYQSILGLMNRDEVTALEKLHALDRTYNKPILREKLNLNGELLQEYSMANETPEKPKANPLENNFIVNSDMYATRKVNDMFNEHSRFLSNVKMELNAKLAQLRGIRYVSRHY